MPVYTLKSGLSVLIERRSAPSFAFDLRLPRGSIHDPPGQQGLASVLEEWLYRGAGGLGARELQGALDDLGLRRGGGCGFEATRLSASGLGQDLPAALSLYADIAQRPQLPSEEFPVLLDLARQDLESLRDNPADRLGLMVREQTFAGSGYAWPVSGTVAGLEALSSAAARRGFSAYGAAGSVLAIVAPQAEERVLEWVAPLFESWRAGAHCGPLLSTPSPRLGLRAHLGLSSQQTQMQLLGAGVSPDSPDWLSWHLALGALSGGSASRLFEAVREERGLAYSVAAGPLLAGRRALLSIYAASTPERAPETLRVIEGELRRWQKGLTPGEFERARRALIASTVFGEESVRARSAAMTCDLTLFGRLRSAQELRAQIEALSLDEVNAFLRRYEPGPLSIFTAGPAELEASYA